MAEFRKDKQFEEQTQSLHYPLLLAYFTRDNEKLEVLEIKDMELQRKGIDIQIKLPDGGLLNVELKTDRYINSPNIFLEDISNSKTNTLGCTLKCESLVLSYGFYYNGLLIRQYLFDMIELKKWYLLNREKYVLIPVRNKEYTTYGRKIPIKTIESFILCKKP